MIILKYLRGNTIRKTFRGAVDPLSAPITAVRLILYAPMVIIVIVGAYSAFMNNEYLPAILFYGFCLLPYLAFFYLTFIKPEIKVIIGSLLVSGYGLWYYFNYVISPHKEAIQALIGVAIFQWIFMVIMGLLYGLNVLAVDLYRFFRSKIRYSRKQIGKGHKNINGQVTANDHQGRKP